MRERHEQGPIHPTALVLLISLAVAGVWIWKRLPAETQNYVIDQAMPVAAGGAGIGIVLLAVTLKIRRRLSQRRERDRLISAFQRETSQEKKLELSFALTECNGYRSDGLDGIASELKDLWVMTLQQASGDERHRIRGMAASHLGVLQDKSVAPFLVMALEDDHAYVRSCAALGWGRLRAPDTRTRLAEVAREDGDQTVRSRAKEALEQIR